MQAQTPTYSRSPDPCTQKESESESGFFRFYANPGLRSPTRDRRCDRHCDAASFPIRPQPSPLPPITSHNPKSTTRRPPHPLNSCLWTKHVMNALSRPVWPTRRLGMSRFSSTTLISRPFSYDHVVIGAGVVGLAVATKLAEYPSNCLALF